MAKTIFYARVSTRDQNPASQIDAAKWLGIKSENIFVEKASGSRHDRPVLAQSLAACEKGDTLACYTPTGVRIDPGGPAITKRGMVFAPLFSEQCKQLRVAINLIGQHLP
jgi:hypothetical protein